MVEGVGASTSPAGVGSTLSPSEPSRSPEAASVPSLQSSTTSKSVAPAQDAILVEAAELPERLEQGNVAIWPGHEGPQEMDGLALRAYSRYLFAIHTQQYLNFIRELDINRLGEASLRREGAEGMKSTVARRKRMSLD